MSLVSFEAVGARAEPYAAQPTLMLQLRVTETTGTPVHALSLRCQIMIEPQRRSYSAGEQERLGDLFGEASRWGETLRPFLWAIVGTTLGRFDGSLEFDLPVACTYDFEVAAAKYLHALSDGGGEIPLDLLFSGTVFSKGEIGFAVEPVAWHEEARFRLPASTWRDVMDVYFPNAGWVRVRRDTLDRLTRFRSERAVPSWDDAFELLLKEAGEE